MRRGWVGALFVLTLGCACGDGGNALPYDGGGDQRDAGGFDGGPDGNVVTLARYCDDGNACTVDSVEGDGCRFDAVPDGTICEDGDLCTLGDRCQSGQCRAGNRAVGELSRLGRLDSLTGKHVAMGPGRPTCVCGSAWTRRRHCRSFGACRRRRPSRRWCGAVWRRIRCAALPAWASSPPR